ncbi:unnamed protein product [Lathyrus sativus]|nr:unnamed protein product [Lathyrus sativus]
MGGARSNNGMMNGGGRRSMICQRRPIPKRGQVKVGIVVGLAISVASIFSRRRIAPRSCSSQ